MLRKLFPILLALVGLGVGIGAGMFLRPSDDTEDHAAAPDAVESAADDHSEAPAATDDHSEAPTTADDHSEAPASDDHGDAAEGGPDYIKMNNQFVVPVVQEGRVEAMVVLAISLEITPGNAETVYQREPKLRDAFLQVMFDHANVGGFSGTFTDGSNLIVLRTNLKEAAALVLGTMVRDVLITDIARQDS